jgi:hypothetical protein
MVYATAVIGASHTGSAIIVKIKVIDAPLITYNVAEVAVSVTS